MSGNIIASVSAPNTTLDDVKPVKLIDAVELNRPGGHQSPDTISNSSQKLLEPFKASPPFDEDVIQYEYNKIPVKPAFPEAKQFQSQITGTENLRAYEVNTNNWHRDNGPWTVSQPWLDQRKDAQAKYETYHESTTVPNSWHNHVKFPTALTNHRPYPFYNADYNRVHIPQHAPPNGGGRNDDFSFNKPVEVPSRRYPTDWQSENRQPSHGQSTQLTGEQHGHSKTYDVDYKSPWKKVIKFLTTFIPIGLLISALTPTVISVTDVNDTATDPYQTSSRYRAVSSKHELASHVLSSLEYFEELNENGCEYRVLCELLLSAHLAKNSERNVANLLDHFSERNVDLKSNEKDLRRVFDAVRSGDCSPITCGLIKNPT
ncbi:uncharacterized protein LOC132705130 [Cylas formicarius]|uniref:uncharacterized protein LOC132705130 n=1 Tax=Cylas formicarius TaxID=197179 RepID=UPI0029585FAB|nr:uncharacterized protein LOC132705130 [Cylas formicarius]